MLAPSRGGPRRGWFAGVGHNLAVNSRDDVCGRGQQLKEGRGVIQAEMDVVEHMLASLTRCALQSRVAPSNEQVAHHFELACKRVGLVITPASAIRIFKRLAHEVRKAESILEFVGPRTGELQ